IGGREDGIGEVQRRHLDGRLPRGSLKGCTARRGALHPQGARSANVKSEPDLHIALYRPEIQQNTSNIGRLCVGLEVALHLVHPIAFSLEERYVRRAGLDYWKHVALREHADEAAFWAWAEGRRVHLYSSHGA